MRADRLEGSGTHGLAGLGLTARSSQIARAARSTFAGAAGAAASCLRQDDFAAIECGFKSRI
jgi:hypothetical protein